MYCLNILYKHICGYAKSRLTYLLSIELRTNAILYVVVGFGSQENSTVMITVKQTLIVKGLLKIFLTADI